MNLIHAWYNMQNNSIETNTYEGYILQINCNKAETGLKTTPWSQHCLDALALDNPLEYARMALNGEFQGWIDSIDDC
ncbi:MAG: toxin-antitoxin system protein [Lachnospiraceae bacterium]|nr:toxin-antitoxin system protein [Lachnospiraceae bacterium]